MSKLKICLIVAVILAVLVLKPEMAFGTRQSYQNNPDTQTSEVVINSPQIAPEIINKINLFFQGFRVSTGQLGEVNGTVEDRTPDELDAWIEKLAFCESRNNPEAINWYDGGSPSYGLLQWKVDSFYRYNQLYKVLPDLEKNEVPNIIMEPETQKRLARLVITDGGENNWFNCVKIIGKPPKSDTANIAGG